jgi:N6-L-threonylcarbamoyladenine synthase
MLAPHLTIKEFHAQLLTLCRVGGEPLGRAQKMPIIAHHRRQPVAFEHREQIRPHLPFAGLDPDHAARSQTSERGIERLRLGMVDDLSFAPRPRWPLDTKAQRSLNGKA